MNYSPQIAVEVRAEMARQRIGPGRLAQSINETRSRLGRRLSGELPFDTDMLVLVAEVLGVPASELVDRAKVRAA